jgi:hypothetical protein
VTLNRIPIPSPNYSSRGGSPVRLIVLHTAEGARTIESLGSYFQGNVEASSHAGADDKPNTIGVYVERAAKAWTQADANPYCVSLELCGFAAWTAAEWDAHPDMVANAGAWMGEEAAAFGIPLRLLSGSEAQGGAAGVCDHAALGAADGGHWDVGSSFPWGAALEIAGGAAPPSTPTAPPGGGGSLGTAPPYPGTPLVNFTAGGGAATWQEAMKARGWTIAVDDLYGDASEGVCRLFQSEASSEGHDTGGVDGIVGPKTWELTWTKPLT